jgi:hypothetical protein
VASNPLSKNTQGGATSAGKMNRTTGVRYSSKRDPWKSLRADIESGVKYFWSKRK